MEIGILHNLPEISKHPSTAEYYMQQMNATNTKKIALLLVLSFLVYHGILNWRYGVDSCHWLLSKGRFKGNNEWQPYGCMMHKYSQIDTRHCLRYMAFLGNKNNFVFVGDENLRQLYMSFINHLRLNVDNISLRSDHGIENEFEERKLNMKVTYIYVDQITDDFIEKLGDFESNQRPPSLFVIGFTDQHFFEGNVTNDIWEFYKMNLTRVAVDLEHLAMKKSKVLWKLQNEVNVIKNLETLNQEQHEKIERFNYEARNVFDYSSVIVWESSWHISKGLLDTSVTRQKLNTLSLSYDVQIILNMYCNDYMNFNDGTCCSSAESYTNLQIVSYACFGGCIVIVFGMILRQWILNICGRTLYTALQQTENGTQKKSISAYNALDYSSPVVSIALLGLIMIYFYLCDRTNFFMKENKYYSEFSFWIPVSYVFALGIFFTEESRFTKVLNRDQTDELKGWILMVVLIYYMTGAHQVLPIHMHIKLLISGYLFLTGYTHFTSLWHSGHSCFVRFFQVIFRVNFMTVVLCLCMNRPYQFYYFVPLISFWLCIIYFLLSLPPRVTVQTVDANPLHYFYLVIKFIGCFSIITILFMSEVFFERVFVTRPWKALFVTTDDDIHAWWHQWKIDRYTVTFGMIFGACFHIAQKYNIFDDNNHGNLFARQTSLIVTLLAIIGVGFYTTFSFFCRNEQNCEEIHSYIVFIPITGYIILRNISGILRTRYSSFFAWFGRISLELFICQYHIWLAADRHGVLVLLPGFPTLNMILTTFIFVCASHEVHRITHSILPYAVPSDWKLIVRNFVIFIIILIPIGKSDGMF